MRPAERPYDLTGLKHRAQTLGFQAGLFGRFGEVQPQAQAAELAGFDDAEQRDLEPGWVRLLSNFGH